MKKLLFLVLLSSTTLSAQKLKTRSAEVSFFSETAIENIEAINKEVSSILVLDDGNVAFLVPIKAFQFEKALMQEHFNENYMESGKFPKASFKGKIKGLNAADLSEKESQFSLNGEMTIHGVTQKISDLPVYLKKQNGKVYLKANFDLLVSDYGIEIPATKADNINNQLALKVYAQY